MCISEGHKTTTNILAHKAFTVSMAMAEQMVACDYVDVESGNQVADKLWSIAFDPIHHTYRVLGKKIGNAFQDGSKLK